MTDSGEPAAPLAPVRARRGSRDAAVIALLIVGALIAGVALGFRLGSQANQTAIVLPTAVPTPASSPTPAPTDAPTFPPYPIQPGVITDELRSAYYQGGLGVSVCVGYEDIVCQGRDGLVPVEPVADVITQQEFEALFGAGPVTELKVDSIFVVEDLGDRYVEGVLFHESNFAFGGYEVSAVNPDGRGIFYMPVAPYDVGRSVLVVRSIPLGTPRRDESLTWEANVIAFDVTR